MILSAIDVYCERTEPGFLAEPLNTLACAAFLPVALWLWRKGQGMPQVRLLAALVAGRGLGGGLFHVWPNLLSAGIYAASSASFVITYLFLASRIALGLSSRQSLLIAIIFLPFVIASFAVVAIQSGMTASIGYLPFPVLLLGYAALLRPQNPAMARGLVLATLGLVVALGFRTADAPMCGAWPYGTHFIWLICALGVLVHLVLLYRAQLLAGGGGGR